MIEKPIVPPIIGGFDCQAGSTQGGRLFEWSRVGEGAVILPQGKAPCGRPLNKKLKNGIILMEKKKSTRRERRIAARKQQILEAAIKVFAEKGFYLATTKEIAEIADVSEGTIYNYFDTKEDLLLGLISHFAALGERQVLFDAALQTDFRDFLLEFSKQRQALIGRYDVLSALLSVLGSNAEVRERYNREIVQPAMTMYEKHLQARIELGQLEPIDPLPLVMRLLVASSLGCWLLLILGDPVLSAALQNPAELAEIGIRALYDQFIPDADKP